jgi:hypothetical protein
MKREVSPWIVVVVVWLALGAITFAYWRGLVAPPPPLAMSRANPAGGGGAMEGEGPPAGLSLSTVSTTAGQTEPGHRDGPAAQAQFDGPSGVAVSAEGVIYVADSRNHCIRKITDGQVSTLAGRPMSGGVGGYADGPGNRARFSGPASVAVAWDGSLLVADTGNHRIRRISREGLVSTVAGAETPRDDLGRPTGGHRDGPGAQAQFCYPMGLAADETGTIYVADAGNHCLRRISPSGQVSTLPQAAGEQMEAPTELVLVGGQLWVSDTAKGVLWVGPREGPLHRWQARSGEKAPTSPAGLAARGSALYLADAGDHCLLRLQGDHLTVIAGAREAGGSGYADGPGLIARFSSPAAVAASRDGSLYVADFGNNCIRRVALGAPSEEEG